MDPDDYPLEDYEDYDPESDVTVECPQCHGSGNAWEGWPCGFCDGYGFLDI